MGDTVLVVLLTDGRANAVASARPLRAMNVDALLIDTSPQPYPQAARLAAEMGAICRLLPSAGATEMSAVVNRAARAGSGLRSA